VGYVVAAELEQNVYELVVLEEVLEFDNVFVA
jgi:predicted tellurium resistance membrane protein TerC